MKNIQSFDEFLGEGFFDFLKDDVVDYTKSEKKEKKGKGKWYDFLKDKEYRNMDEPTKKEDPKAIVDFYKKVANEEEEEEGRTSYTTKQEVLDDYQKRIARRKDLAKNYEKRKDQKYKSVNPK